MVKLRMCLNVSDIYVVNKAFFYILCNVLRPNGDAAEEEFTRKLVHHLKTNFKRIADKLMGKPSVAQAEKADRKLGGFRQLHVVIPTPGTG